MNRIERLFQWLLCLYPRGFQARFAEEMREVFRAGLAEAQARGETKRFLLREVLHLPANLASVYLWSMRAADSPQAALAGAGIGAPTGQGERWTGQLLAGLPHLIMGLIMVSTALLTGVPGVSVDLLGYTLTGIFGLALLGVVVSGITRGWKRWSASWLSYLFIILVGLLSLAGQALEAKFGHRGNWLYISQTLVVPLLLAYLLYKIACADRLRGLLAAVAPTTLAWIFFQEFVPNLARSLAWAWICLIACTGAVMMLRARRLPTALAWALLVPVLAGPPIVYLGIFMGGMRTADSSLRDVFQQYLIFLPSVLAVPLGPQLAVSLRSLGRRYASTGGAVFYRMGLGGMLLGVLVVLFWYLIKTGSGFFWFRGILASQDIGLAVAAVLYLAGFGLLAWAILRSPEYQTSDLARLAVLFVLLPGVLFAIGLLVPAFSSQNGPKGVLGGLGLAWALASAAWIVREDRG